MDQGVTVLTAARQAHLHVIHVTFGCYTNDGSDLEFFKQRTIGDEHSKLKERIVPVRCVCSSCCAAQCLRCLRAAKVSPWRKPVPELAFALSCSCPDAAAVGVCTQPEYSPAPGEAVLLTSTTSAFASTGLFRLVSVVLLAALCLSCHPLPGANAASLVTSCAGLEQILKNMHVVYLIFIGSYSDGCLGLTAADSISRGFLPTVRTTLTRECCVDVLLEAY